MIDELNAYDEVCEFFSAAWAATDWMPTEAVPPVIMWDGRMQDELPPIDQPSIRFKMDPGLVKQGSLGDHNGQKRWANSGIISVQAFAPLSYDDALEVAQYVAIMAKRVFQGKATPNGMWFRNCRTNRVGPTGGWFQFNTIIEYTFDELR